MKKILLSLLCGVMVIGIATGCGKNNEEGTNPSTNNNGEVNNQTESNNSKPDEPSSILTSTYKVPSKQMYIDYTYHKIEKGYTEVFLVDNVKFATFTALYEEKGTDAKAAYKDTYDSFEYAMENLTYINSIEIEEEKTTKINGIDVYQFKGTMNYNRYDPKKEGFIIGYSFVYDGFPCSIIGGVSDLEQPQEEIDEITLVVHEMMKSVRSEFEK